MDWYLYRCPHCGKLVKRCGDGEYIMKPDGTPKKWVKSWCGEKGVDARIKLLQGVEDGKHS